METHGVVTILIADDHPVFRKGLRDMVLMSGGRAVPVLRVGEHAMIGWDAREFERLRSGRFKRR